jgi:hypothetical protein
MNKESKFYDFSQYHLTDEVIKKESIGWNGTSIKTLPFYELFNHTRLGLEELKKLKLYDVVSLSSDDYFETYLVIPFKVKSQYHVEFNKEISDDNKQFLLNYTLLKYYDDNDKYLFIPPEGIPAIEKHGTHFFDNILEFNTSISGIIVDNYYLKNFEKFEKNVKDLSIETFNYDRLLFIHFDDHYLSITDSHEELSNLLKKKKILIPSMKQIDQMNNVQLIESVIKGLPKNRPTPYQKGLSLKLNISKSETKECKRSSKKKEDLIQEIEELKKQVETLQLKIQSFESESKSKSKSKNKVVSDDKTTLFLENMIETIQNHIHKK